MLQTANKNGRNRRCFVTVGTTQFNELIESVTSIEVLRTLFSLGVAELLIQCGDGRIPDGLYREKLLEPDDAEVWKGFLHEINVKVNFSFKITLTIIYQFDVRLSCTK